MTTPTDERWHGECLCGKIRFSWAGPSLWCAHCHCTLCQRAHGAAFVTWVGADSARFSIDRGAPVWYASGPQSRRAFCGDCGSSMLFESAQWPGETHIARALVAGSIDLLPQGHVNADTAVDWTAQDAHLPRKPAP